MDTDNQTKVTYTPIDGGDEYTLVRATNANIRNVCRVLWSCKGLSKEERVFYAMQGGLVAKGEDGDEYEMPQLYDAHELHIHLAKALFTGFPELSEEQCDNLDRAEVGAAHDNFLASFGLIPYQVMVLLKLLPTDRNSTTADPTKIGSSTFTNSSLGGFV